MGALNELDSLLERLEATAQPVAGGGDALDAALAAAPRSTAVRRLRDDAVMQRFRAELVAGRLQLETVRGFLDLLAQVLDTVLPRR